MISGTRESTSTCSQCSTSFTPMNARISASPDEREISRFSRPFTREKSARRTNSAKALAADTMNDP